MRRFVPLLVILGCAPSNDSVDPSATGSETGTSMPGSSENPTTASGASTVDAASSDGNNDDTAVGSDDTTPASSTTAQVDTATTDSSDESSDDDDGGSAACDDLMACCEQLGADIYVGCATVVDLDMPGLCDSTLATYHQEGYCTGEPYCDDLAACCGDLPPGPGWEETCSYYADLGNQPQCAMLISDYQLSGYCE